MTYEREKPMTIKPRDITLTPRLDILDKVILFLYGLYFILSPFYLWSSGLPQIADIIMVLTLMLYLIQNSFVIRLKDSSFKFFLIGLLFIFWVVITNLVWILNLQTAKFFLQNTIFYIYNFIIGILTASLAYKYKNVLLATVFNAIILSVLIQLLFFFIGGRVIGGRNTVFFNNPNQLGYYALLVVNYIIFFHNNLKIKWEYLVIGLLASFILVLSSLSNGSIIAWVFMFTMFLMSRTTNKKIKTRIMLITIAVLGIVMYLYNYTDLIKSNELYQELNLRLSTTQSKIETSVEGRGYDRIAEHPEYWLFGAGEGGYFRFEIPIEFHSTLGNIQLSYGLIGTILFATYMFQALKRDYYTNGYILGSLMIYGYAHNGIRNTMFWILLSLMVMYQNKKIVTYISKFE